MKPTIINALKNRLSSSASRARTRGSNRITTLNGSGSKKRSSNPSHALLYRRLHVIFTLLVATGWMALWNSYNHDSSTPPSSSTTGMLETWRDDESSIAGSSMNAGTFPNVDGGGDNVPSERHDGGRSTSQEDHDDRNDVHDDPDIVPERTPTHEACNDFDGVYHVAMGDIGGAAGTVFFQFVIGQLIYAERTNLKPWVYLNNVSYIAYDEAVHGRGSPGVRWKAQVGRNATWIFRPGGHWRDAIPGPLDDGPTHQEELFVAGTGVWEHYFEPVSDFVPGDSSCERKPYVTLDLKLITPGIHGFAPWAPSCWRYQYLPDYITKPHTPITEWLEPQRVIGYNTAQKYIRFRPYLLSAAERVNPNCDVRSNPCLGLHIRHSDKAAGRKVIMTEEFMAYAQAFLHAGGRQIYLATDSNNVLNEIETKWPRDVTTHIRTIGSEVVRSNDEQAVFDIGSHHRTNIEAFTEIIAMSKCQFLVHGLSAMSESSIWMNIGLHNRSVNLEDPDHIGPGSFGTLVQMVLNGEEEDRWPHPVKTDAWWNANAQKPTINTVPTNNACEGHKGILHISSVGPNSGAGAAFFTDVLNQLLYAEQYDLLPWIHLAPEKAKLVYDETIHQGSPNSTAAFRVLDGFAVGTEVDPSNRRIIYPGKPVQRALRLDEKMYIVEGTGIWSSYFLPVSEFVPGDRSCDGKPIVEMDQRLISPGMNSYCPWALKAWRYDEMPDKHWKNETQSISAYMEPMRLKAHSLVKRYIEFHPAIAKKAVQINFMSQSQSCMAVHFRSGDKSGKYRKKITADEFLPYMYAFVEAGGQCIYIASDSHKPMHFLERNHPQLWKIVHTQGKYVVRTTKDYPTHFIDDHHRVNSETLVDILAMSKCQLLLHAYSTVSEAAIYINMNLHNNSVNIEDPRRISPDAFKAMSRSILIMHTKKDDRKAPFAAEGQGNTGSAVDVVDARHFTFDNVTILHRNVVRSCRSNAVVYLAQKQHSTYGRDSYSILLQSLNLLYKNYLEDESHMNNTDVFLFHTGDFNRTDLDVIESRLGPYSKGAVRLVDLSNSPYWSRPKSNEKDDPRSWYAYPLFSEGYRRMMHWYAIDIWEFFRRLNQATGCAYRYLFRLDEDSFIHSPIRYDVFDFFERRQYVYGYRMCAYEMQVSQRMWTWYKKRNAKFEPKRDLNLEMCGFYNNFFVADLTFFNSIPVRKFLSFIDKQGHIYRRRLGDLMIHTMSVIAFASSRSIHRFLDFTYEHATLNQSNGCLIWGGIQAGYEDLNASETLNNFYQRMLVDRGCPGNATVLTEPDLSPTYSHIPGHQRGKVALQTIVAGRVELPAGKGILSG